MHFAHRTELCPGAGVQHHQHFHIGQFRRLHVDVDRLDAAMRIDELIIRRRRLAIDDPHSFAEFV